MSTMKRIPLFVEDWKVYTPILGVLLSEKLNEICAENEPRKKKGRVDYSEMLQSDTFQTEAMSIVKKLMKDRCMPPSIEEMWIFLENRFKVSHVKLSRV